jgi:hypothetical protein
MYPLFLGQCLKEATKFRTLGEDRVRNLSITWCSLSPLRTSTSFCPSSFSKCFKRKVSLVAKVMVNAVALGRTLLLNDLLPSSNYANPNELLFESNFLLVHNVINASWTQFHTKRGDIIGFAKRWTRCKTIPSKLMNNITNPSCLVFTFVKKKEVTCIILAL